MMNYNFMQPLEYTALVKVASTMWNEEDVWDLISLKRSRVKFHVNRQLKDKIVEKISRLSLPKLLEKKLADLVDPMGLEIIKWKQYHENYFPAQFVDESLDKLCWTQRGTVDKEKTAEILVKNENIFITFRYKLACIYCLEHDIPVLWGKMPQHLRNTYYSEKRSPKAESKFFEVVWAYGLNGRLNELTCYMGEIFGVLIGPFQYGFKLAVLSANEVAAKYFFQMLTPEERNNSLVQFITYVVPSNLESLNNGVPKACFPGILCFLLSQMSEKQQKKVFGEHCFDVVSLFLGWPFQTLFMRLVNSVWTSLSINDYHRLLCLVASKIECGARDFNYQRLFREFWYQSPNSYRRCIVSSPALASKLLLDLFLAPDKNNIWLIFNEASIQEKEDIIFVHDGMDLCSMLVTCNKWDLLKLFIDECIPSRSIRSKFMNKLKKYVLRKEFVFHRFINPGHLIRYEKSLWSKICRNLYKEEIKKRMVNVNEGNKRRSKRLCNRSLAN